MTDPAQRAESVKINKDLYFVTLVVSIFLILWVFWLNIALHWILIEISVRIYLAETHQYIDEYLPNTLCTRKILKTVTKVNR